MFTNVFINVSVNFWASVSANSSTNICKWTNTMQNKKFAARLLPQSFLKISLIFSYIFFKFQRIMWDKNEIELVIFARVASNVILWPLRKYLSRRSVIRSLEMRCENWGVVFVSLPWTWRGKRNDDKFYLIESDFDHANTD